MKFKIVACVNNSLSLGYNGNLMYHISNDLKNFKRITYDSVVIMGSKTFESLPNGALKNRINIVLTHNKNYNANDCIVVNSIEECVELCEREFNNKECYIIGGGKVYEEFFKNDLIDTVYLTEVSDNKEGDTFFPNVLFDNDNWRIFYQTDTQYDRQTKLNYFFRIYKKIVNKD